MHRVCILLGSNIDPVANMRRAVNMLRIVSQVEAISSTWETPAVGSPGPNFLNMASTIYTDLPANLIKDGVLRPIEDKLGRVRTADKNAPRTMDLDIVVFDGEATDTALWSRAHVALPVAEVLPELCHPESGQRLVDIAVELGKNSGAVRRPSIVC